MTDDASSGEIEASVIDLSEASVWSELSPTGLPTASLIVRSLLPPPPPPSSPPIGSDTSAASFHDTSAEPVVIDPTTVDDLAPILQSDRLALGDEIARGGMAMIHHAYDNVIRRQVALKCPHPSPGEDLPDAAQLLVEEAQITGQLEHPNIVPIHDLKPDGSMFSMALVRGHTYRRMINESARAGHPPHLLRRALEVFLKVCDAVAFAHGRGVIHRDLKPDNIMIGSHGQVYVMDWGCALLVAPPPPTDASAPPLPRVTVSHPSARRSAPNVLLGTAAYMAPEQAHGHVDEVSPRSDVYSLGAILYHLLTRRGPHQAATFVEAVLRAQAGEVKPPAEAAPGKPMPSGLVAIAMKALAQDPDDRYPDVPALRTAVEGFLIGAGAFPQRRAEAGALIVREGDHGETAYMIDSGVCEASRTIKGIRTVVRRMTAGDVFGETAIVMDQPRSASVTAVTDVVLTEISRAALDADLGMSAWTGAFLRTLATRFRDAERRLDDGGRVSSSRFARVVEAARVYLRVAGKAGAGGWRLAAWPALRDALAEELQVDPELVAEAVRGSNSLRLDDAELVISGLV